MNAATETLTDPTGIYTPELLNDEQRKYLRMHMISYSDPSNYKNIRQWEVFRGEVNVVEVHPSFPEVPVMTHDGKSDWGLSCAKTWRTSSRRAAVEIARVQRSKPNKNDRLHNAFVVARVMDATLAVIDFLNNWTDADGVARQDAEGYEQAALVMYNTVNWDGENGDVCTSAACNIPDIWAVALNLGIKGEYGWRRDSRKSAKLLINRLGWILRRYAEQGIIPAPTAIGLSDAMSAAFSIQKS